ncbi:Glyoxalase/Bleomycin resistance protein/Dihydroxybiphenyl dioxygenase [Lasiosphaeris hirsuta]|uniref:Glyoxalase/Bleomycin resistance protein/Dihydroxybiphenyl dioxygenase n=1 Tax=Lasiosphaeris hirsuta TaxID=260670 RepID=A0AA39ZXL6_9PEZI|nr:Glyoxalase/Bleomycin resistance protein/Dihydroxybiphenyl dioxygenase [Lasiosphaeris hirsuta]
MMEFMTPPEAEVIGSLKTANPTGNFCFIEIPTVDVQRAITFYRKVFGWAINPVFNGVQGHADNVKSMYCFNQGNILGCFSELSDPNDMMTMGISPGTTKIPITFGVTVDDVDETSQKVVECGGKVHRQKFAIPPGKFGDSARYIDTEGNMIAVWTPPAM